MNNTKDIKKIIKHREYYIFKQTLDRNLSEGYELIGKETLCTDGVWVALVKKTVKWDNPNPGKQHKFWK